MTRIIVTGATGLIGRRVVEHLLSQGHQLTVLLHRNEGSSPFGPEIRVCRGDVTLPDTLAGKFSGCDLVIHLAGCTIARSRKDFYHVNRDGTLNVARQCASLQTPPKMLFISSLAACGPSPAARPLKESDPPKPVSHYGASKLEAEQGLLAMAGELPIQIVRPPSVVADSDPYLLGLFRAAKWGWVFLAGSGTHRYSFIHLDDLSRALTHVSISDCVQAQAPKRQATTPETGADQNPGIVFLAQQPPMTFAEVAEIVSDEIGTGRIRSVHVPSPLCWALAATNAIAAKMLGIRPLLNIDKMREGMAGGWMCDSSRLTDDLGFQFQVSLQERIRQTAERYQAKEWL